MITKKQKRLIVLPVLAVILLALIIWIVWANTALELNIYTIKSEKLPKSFSGFRIAHVSDLHNAQMGEDNEKLLSLLSEAEPDIIAITGDLIDSRVTNTTIALQFMKEAMKIAPCYYVTGNHESRVDQYFKLREDLIAIGVVVLEDERIALERGNESISIIGVNDPSFQTDYLLGDAEDVMQSKLQKMADEQFYTILLSHRPELFDIYVENGINLVLSGHAHGGQFRLPLIGGLVAPNQGFFPEYDAGLYTNNSTHMIISRGIGNSIIPFRFNNRPEVILIELVRSS